MGIERGRIACELHGVRPFSTHRRRITARRFPRAGLVKPRLRRPLLTTRRSESEAVLTHCEDLGDGRHVLEFAQPSLDLMLYEDAAGTIAEWVTVEGRLLALIRVGRA